MIDSKKYKGIEYIQLNELPETQQEKLLNTIDQDVFIKIMVDGKIIARCIQYKDYIRWFNTVYESPVIVIKKEEEKVEEIELKPDLVLK